jgi:hypothetical protein
MARREDIRKGSFVVADGGKAEFGSTRRDRIAKGKFMTVDAVVDRPAKIEKQFPEMAGAIEAAGRLPTAADLAQHWARQAELEQRVADLKVKVKAVKRK